MAEAALWLMVLGLLAVLAWRAASCNFSYWRKTRRLPLVTASPAELLPKEPRWVHREHKWPNPGTPGGWALSPEHCDAYARLAELRSRRWQNLTTAANLSFAALLGVVVTQIGTIHAVLTDAGAFDYPPLGLWERLQSYWAPELRLGWVAVVAASILMAGTINRMDYGELSSRYRAASWQQRQELAAVGVAQPPGASAKPHRTIVDLIKRLFGAAG